MKKIRTNLTNKLEAQPKTTSIGQGKNSCPKRRGKKKLRGQGK